MNRTRNPLSPESRRCATRSRAPNQCLRSPQSTATGSTFPAADWDGRRSRRRTVRTAPRRTRRRHAHPRSVAAADRTNVHPRPANGTSRSAVPGFMPGPCVDSWPCGSEVRRIDRVDPLRPLTPHFQFDFGIPTFQRPSASLLIGDRALSGRTEANTQWVKKKQAVSVHLQRISQSRFPRIARHLGWWPDSPSGTGRAARTGQADRRASDGFATRHKEEVSVRRSGAAIGLQPPRRLPGSQRCRASLRRSDLSLARLEKELGSRRGAYVASAKLRGRAAGQ